jgi:hypothetical protein
MRLIELTDQQHETLSRLAHDGTLNPPKRNDPDSIHAANALAREMGRHLKDAEEVAELSFIDKLFDLFPELKGFDQETGEKALFKESLEALQRVAHPRMKKEPLVIGSFLLKIMSNPDAAGIIIADFWHRGWTSA